MGLQDRPAREPDSRIKVKVFLHSRSHSSGHKTAPLIAGYMPKPRNGRVLIKDDHMVGVTQGADIRQGKGVDGGLRGLLYEQQ